MITSIVFDFGGVLIDWSPYHLYHKLLPSDADITAFLDEIGFKDTNPRLDAGLPFAEWVAEYSRKFPHRRDLIEAFNTRWPETSGEAIQGTVDILRELKALGHPVFGLSNWSAESFARVKDRYSFIDELDDYLLSGMVGVVKPGEEIFRLFLSRTGRQAAECVFIEDAEANINTANRLGFTTILFQSPGQLRLELEALEILPKNCG